MMHAFIHANKKSVWVWLTGIFRENHKLPLELYRQSPCFDNRNGRYGYLDTAQWLFKLEEINIVRNIHQGYIARYM